VKITLRQLEIFDAIANCGQVTRAAAQVAITQAAASLALADLENQLGAALFHRQGRALHLTGQGRALLPLVREVLERARDIEHLAQPKTSTMSLHLAASVTIGNHVLPSILAAFMRQYPRSQVHSKRGNTAQVLASLRGFDIDIGFIEGPAGDADLVCLPWLTDTLQVFAAPTHRLAGKTVGKRELARAAWVSREPGSGTRSQWEHALHSLGLAPRIVLELEQPEALRRCVAQGLGLGCLSRLEVDEALMQGTLAPVCTPDLALERRLHIVLRRDAYRPAAVLALLRHAQVAEEVV
jgi:DNA-binding transcriptional LysR family regulator